MCMPKEACTRVFPDHCLLGQVTSGPLKYPHRRAHTATGHLCTNKLRSLTHYRVWKQGTEGFIHVIAPVAQGKMYPCIHNVHMQGTFLERNGCGEGRTCAPWVVLYHARVVMKTTEPKDRWEVSVHWHHINSGPAPTSPLLGLVPYFLSQGIMFLKEREQSISKGDSCGLVTTSQSRRLLPGDRCEEASLYFTSANRSQEVKSVALSKEAGDISRSTDFKVCSVFTTVMCKQYKLAKKDVHKHWHIHTMT